MNAQQAAFIDKIAPAAQSAWIEYGVLPSLTIAQAILESGWGNSGLTKQANNLFGMKGSYCGNSINYPTKEYVDGRYIDTVGIFKKYGSWAESLKDHAELFHRASRYHNLLHCRDYRMVCVMVQQDGYATSPEYAQSLIRLIEQYNLYEYDITVKMWIFESGKVTAGDLNSFIDLAKRLELKDYSVKEI